MEDRKKMDELHDAFEKDIRDSCTKLVKESKSFSEDLWGSIANVGWSRVENGVPVPDSYVGMSFRHIAGLIAEMRDDDTEYMDWYMCSNDGHARENVKKVLASKGWAPIDEENVRR